MHGRSRLLDRTSRFEPIAKPSVPNGKQVDARLRATLEPRFGHSFADVRVHDDPDADALTRANGALALTSGRDVYFRQGEYDPSSVDGLHMLVHELAHTVQQDGNRGSAPGGLGARGDSFEQEAESAARTVLDGGTATLQPSASAPSTQRWQAPDGDWWLDTVGSGLFTGVNALETIPGAGNLLSAGLGAGAGLLSTGFDLLGYDGLANGAHSMMMHHTLNAVPLLGNLRAAKSAGQDAMATVGNLAGIDSSTAEEDFAFGGAQDEVTSGLHSLWSGFWG
jgi:hypothetical protein